MYVRLCESLNSVGKLVPVTDVAKAILDQNKDYYTSIFQYTESQKSLADEVIEVEKDGKKFKRSKGVSSIRDVVTNRLVFDFDSSNLQDAKLDTVELLSRLEKKGVNTESDVNICFSGSKGFSVELNTTDTFTPQEFKNIVHSLALDLKTFDPKIVDPNRIFRLPFTRHPKTGLYKTPISKDELEGLSIDEIKDIAATKCTIDGQYLSHTAALPKAIKDLKTVELKQEKQILNSEELDLNKKPSWLSNWKYALSRGFFIEGTRSYALTILAATCRNQFMSQDQAKYFLLAAAEEQARRFNCEPFGLDEIEKNIIEVVYGPSWKGGSWAEDNFPEDLKKLLIDSGIPRDNITYDKGLETVTDIYSVFKDYAVNIDANTIKTGIPGLDDIVRITTSMLVGVLGSPGAGKTATVLNILKNMSESGETSVFFSLDMGRPLVFQKMVQQLTGFDSDYLYKIYQDNDQTKQEFIRKTIEAHYKNIQLCFKTGASVDDLKKYIIDYEKNTGKKVRMVAVDYLEKVTGPYSDATANSGHVASKLQELANDLQVCVIVLLQPQKSVGVPSDPILSYRNIKGASVIEQDCRVVLSLWREGYDPRSYENDKFITYAVLKNTMGQLGHIECGWDGLRGNVYELDDGEKVVLEELKRAKAQRAAEEDGW
jgi:hypothetical protein